VPSLEMPSECRRLSLPLLGSATLNSAISVNRPSRAPEMSVTMSSPGSVPLGFV
jgi:hypothetical protein